MHECIAVTSEVRTSYDLTLNIHLFVQVFKRYYFEISHNIHNLVYWLKYIEGWFINIMLMLADFATWFINIYWGEVIRKCQEDIQQIYILNEFDDLRLLMLADSAIRCCFILNCNLLINTSRSEMNKSNQGDIRNLSVQV